MNLSDAVARIVKESNRRQGLEALADVALLHEFTRLKQLRTEARRLNEEAFRDALVAAEAKAPALVPHNGMLRMWEIEEAREQIRVQSQVIRAEVFARLSDRMELCQAIFCRRTSWRYRPIVG